MFEGESGLKIYLSVIIPAYNEEKRIAETLSEVCTYLSGQSYVYEIIVVNDGSKDKTVECVERFISEGNNLQIIDNWENMGKGHAVRQGLMKAIGEYRLFMDADNSTPVAEIEKFFKFLKSDNGIVIGSRSISGSIIIKSQPFYRVILGRFYVLLVRMITGLGDIKDTQCGFKLFSAGAIKEVLPLCKINGWSFDVEMLIIARKLGYKIYEVPIHWIHHSQTKVKFLPMVTMILDLVRIRFNLIKINNLK